ncbi:MAG: UDP-N-acetylmuramoyl-L-alanine--D-glutamate ligase [Polyangiaceae bacterium]|nr:UDP-N-acetylmuramoyl-L-alanine--D-glutamate ligase [Polyangiaceae bacterium]
MESFATTLSSSNVVVIGLGRSGVAAARLAAKHGARVTGTDSAPLSKLSAEARALEAEGVRIVADGHEGIRFEEASLVVISPGVPSFPALAAAEVAGTGVIGEIELAWRLLPDVPVIGIGGSNGKTTTTTLAGVMLEALGAKPFVGGNIGTPPAEILVDGSVAGHDVIVLELSSFQCERMPTFRPRRAALLNVSPNHLDRYPSFDAYVHAKGNMFANQDVTCAAVVPDADPLCRREAERGGGTLLSFGPTDREAAAFAFDREAIFDRRRGIRYPRKDIRLVGNHNAANICAVLALLDDRDPDPDVVREVLATFEALPHRISRVAEKSGVTYYDDSKATSVAAAVAAIEGLAEDKVVLIAGGRDKLGAYDPLVSALRARGRAAVLIGEAAERIAAAIGDAAPIERAASMEEAVERAAKLARPGDAVLLSPACSSFDMFRDYKHRGDAFVDAVKKLSA